MYLYVRLAIILRIFFVSLYYLPFFLVARNLLSNIFSFFVTFISQKFVARNYK
jgi:hypothetical protein